jgi:hypothetical protein
MSEPFVDLFWHVEGPVPVNCSEERCPGGGDTPRHYLEWLGVVNKLGFAHQQTFLFIHAT